LGKSHLHGEVTTQPWPSAESLRMRLFGVQWCSKNFTLVRPIIGIAGLFAQREIRFLIGHVWQKRRMFL
jgi:hypothetical protein